VVFNLLLGPGEAVYPAAVSSPRPYGLAVAVALFAGIMVLPAPPGLSRAGLGTIAVLTFAVVVWVTEAVSYEVSAFVILALLTLVLGFLPDPAQAGASPGTARGLAVAMEGLANPATALVAAATFISAGMMLTGLDRRIALLILSHVGSSTKGLLAGVILVCAALSLVVPSTTARVACIVPIVAGIIKVFGVGEKGAFAGMLMIAAAQADTIWNVGLKTGAAQNFVTAGFIEKMLGGVQVSWPQWLAAGLPFSLIMSVALFLVLLVALPPEVAAVPGGHEAVTAQLAAMGPVSAREWRLLGIAGLLLVFWATEGTLHRLDTATITVLGVTVMLLPGAGVMSWQEAQPRVPWGTIALFAVGISLGTALLRTRAAEWLADYVASEVGLALLPPVGIIAVLMVLMVVLHLGFASATALASAMIPIVIAILVKAQAHNPALNAVGITLIVHFTACFGFVLPVNAPQNMVAYATGTFTPRDFLRTGIPLTILACLTVLALSLTYWRWIGLVTR
jgi:solute carrier family 13 (sodium-dependent dicarboxylate transporter), member 2/3/5